MIQNSQVKEIFRFTPEICGFGEIQSAWSPDNNMIALAGENRVIRILDRQGKVMLEIPSKHAPKIDDLAWDKDNDSLAILTATSAISIWSMGQRKFQDIEMANQKEKASYISWSAQAPVLAIGSDKGSVVFFNRKNQRKIPCISKHGKKVTCGDWNKEGNCITGSDDKILTVSNSTGDTIHDSFIVRGEINDVRWCPYKDASKPLRCVASIVSGKQMLYLRPEDQKHFLFKFHDNFGKALTFRWFDHNKLIVGFSSGIVSMISTKSTEPGKELFQVQVGNNPIECLEVNTDLKKLAVAASGAVRFFSLVDWKEIHEDKIDIMKSCGKITRIHWTSDGSILTIATSNGYFMGFLTVIPSLYSAFDQHAAILSSLTEVSVVDCAKNNMVVAKTELQIEPTFLNLGPFHFAVGINNSIWYYRWNQGRAAADQAAATVALSCKREYFGTIKQVVMNDTWTAVLSEGKVSLHVIEDESAPDIRFPLGNGDPPITYIALADSFLLLIDQTGKLSYYLIEDQAFILEHNGENPLIKVFPNKTGTKCICIDATGHGYMLNPVDESLIMIPNFQAETDSVLWDIDDQNLFITVAQDMMHTYMFLPLSLDGPQIVHLPEYLRIDEVDKPKAGVVTQIDKDMKPVILKDGYVYSNTRADGIRGQFLTTHSYMNQWRGEADSDEGNLRYFLQNLATHKFERAIEVSRVAQRFSQQFFEVLGKQCLKFVELELAEIAFQECKNVGMVYSIQSIKHETEKNVLIGHVACILFKPDTAQDMFLRSSQPELALDMRMDLQDWFAALKLAKQIAPEREQFICRKLASQVENQGNTAEAQKLYERAYVNPSSEIKDKRINIEEHNAQCYAGIARTSIKMGGMPRGMKIAQELNDKNLIIEIAGVCEQMKQWPEAARLYQKGGLVEKAVSIYIQIGMFQAAHPLMDQITSPSILVLVAKAKEAEKNYREAEKAYERANDYENIIRLNLDHLDNPERAKQIFRTKSQLPQCALMIANFCELKGSKKEAIEFLVLGGKRENAFVIAQSHQEMDEYAKIILQIDERNIDEHLRIAQFYEGKSQWGRAAKHYEKSEQLNKALKLYIQEGDTCIPDMIDMVAKAKLDALTHELVDYLMGETDNIPKEPQHTFKLYRALGNTTQAVKIAVNISQQEQEIGNYKYAHEILLDTFKDIRASNNRIPFELYNKLMLLHSYQLAKKLVKLGNHLGAARLLIRVCNNISLFPQNMSNIMTSCIGECSQSGLKRQAYHWACVLIRPEHIDQIPPKFKSKIEGIARRPVKAEDEQEPNTPCPSCGFDIPETKLDCPSCKNLLPFCLASGKHMILQDYSKCPNCLMPCNNTDMKRVLEGEPVCPMCAAEVMPMQVKISEHAEVEFKELMTLMKDSTDPTEEGEGDATSP